MTLSRFSKLCEVLENSKGKRETLSENFSAFSDGEILIRILCEEYESNNIGVTNARKWIANAFGCFDEEIAEYEKMWGDLGEGMCQFIGETSEKIEDDSISLKQLIHLLTMDCSVSNGQSYELFNEAVNKMSGLELKWFLRYWTRTPRNGVSCSTVNKALADYFSNNDVLMYGKFHKSSIVYRYLINGQSPPCTVMHGGFIPCVLAKKFVGKLPDDYLVDVKYDGNRYQIHRLDDSVIIFNRKGNVVTEQYPDIVEIVKKFNAHQFVIDTEIYPVRADGSPAEHKLLAKRVHSKDKEAAVRECPVKLAIFDVLYFMEETMIGQTYRMRLSHLQDFPSEYRADSWDNNHPIEAAYNTAISMGHEGIMIKDKDTEYDVGKRSASLLKHKPARIDLDVVITSARYGEGKRSDVFGSFGISVKGRWSGEFVELGFVGSGFSDSDLIMLTTECKKIVSAYAPPPRNTFELLPRIVIEVTGDLISQDASGKYSIRFPRVRRIRRDKYVSDINNIHDVMSMA